MRLEGRPVVETSTYKAGKVGVTAQTVEVVAVVVGWVVVLGRAAGVPQPLDIHPMEGGAGMVEAAEAASKTGQAEGSKATVVRCHPC